MLSIVRLNIVGIIILSGLLIHLETWASTKEYQDLYYRLKNLYDIGEYSKCVTECSRIITMNEKCLVEAKKYRLLANLYELKADCLNRMGSIDQAVSLLDSISAKLQQKLPKDHVARIKLKMGHMYKQAGLYSKALSSFQKVEQEYAQVFPERFAKYARENYDDIASKQVAVISGEVSLEDDSNYESVTIKLFNGFEESETKTLQNGKYSIPLFSSTPHTRFSLFAYKKGCKPFITNMVFDGRSKIEIKKIQLQKLPNKDIGVVAGVVFIPVSGGKRRPHHGIARLEKHEIKFQKVSENQKGQEATRSDWIFVSSDDNGIYTALLTAGLYLMKNERKEKIFRLTRGEVIILNISRGEILVD